MRRYLFLFFALVIIALPGMRSAPLAAAQGIATLEPVQGLVQVLYAGEDVWQTINEPVFVDEGDAIRTDRTGLAYLIFFEGIESEIKANTWVIVTTLELPAEEDDDLSIALDVLVGATLTSVEAALDPEDRFEIHTPSATAVVRGTRWWTIVDRDGKNTFIVEEGTVSISFNQDGEEAPEIELPAGQGLVIDSTGEASEPSDDLAPPADPDPAPLADPTCGNNICEDDEDCPLDCDPPPTTCGNALCDADEDIVRCPGDCLPQSTMCTITGDNINIRSGPDTVFPVVSVMQSGETLAVMGRNTAGTWLVVAPNGVNSWVARRVVPLRGPCDMVPVRTAPPPPPPIPTPQPAAPATGTWGACGSCDNCGEYPAIECMTSPEGACVWNPAACRSGIAATPGSLTVGASQFDCIAPADIAVTATYTPPLESPGAVLASYSASGDSLSPVDSYFQTSPTSFTINISCNIPGFGSVTATATDSNGLSYFVSFTVWVQG